MFSHSSKNTHHSFHPFKIPTALFAYLICVCVCVCVCVCTSCMWGRCVSLLNFEVGSFSSALFPPFILIYLSEVVFRDVPCHLSARPIKHTVMTDWPRSKLITDWLTERVALFCSAVFDSCLPDISGSGNFKCAGVFPRATPLSLTLKVTWIWIPPLLPAHTYWWWSLRSTQRDYNSERRSDLGRRSVSLSARVCVLSREPEGCGREAEERGERRPGGGGGVRGSCG